MECERMCTQVRVKEREYVNEAKEAACDEVGEPSNHSSCGLIQRKSLVAGIRMKSRGVFDRMVANDDGTKQ